MHLVLCHLADASAVATFHALRERSRGVVECVSVEALCAALTWELRLKGDETRAVARLADGRVLDAERIEGVLNRTSIVAPVGIERVAEDEAAYAREEFTAFVLGWLTALRRVVNAPSPQGLSGRHATPLEWSVRAVRAGLRVVPRLDATPAAPAPPRHAFTWTVTDWAYVVGDRVVGAPLDADTTAGCLALARDVGAELLGVGLARFPDGPAFVTATPTPPLPASDATFLDALCERIGLAVRA